MAILAQRQLTPRVAQSSNDSVSALVQGMHQKATTLAGRVC